MNDSGSLQILKFESIRLTGLRLMQVEILKELQDRPEAVQLHGVYQVCPVPLTIAHPAWHPCACPDHHIVNIIFASYGGSQYGILIRRSLLQDEDSVFIVTELCRGGSLENFLLVSLIASPSTAQAPPASHSLYKISAALI